MGLPLLLIHGLFRDRTLRSTKGYDDFSSCVLYVLDLSSRSHLGCRRNGHGDPFKLGAVAVTFFFVFWASFAMGVLGVPWLYPTEVNALAFRAKGASVAMASNWIMNYMVAQITPPG